MSRGCCQGEIDLLNQNLQYLLEKQKQLKNKYHELLVENIKKDIIINDLKEKIESEKINHYSGVLSSNCVQKLKIIDKSKKKDSTFIKCIINELYSKEELKKKTVHGKSKDSKKTPISPEKKKLLKKLLEERLQDVDDEEERELRRSCLNKLIRNAIDAAR